MCVLLVFPRLASPAAVGVNVFDAQMNYRELPTADLFLRLPFGATRRVSLLFASCHHFQLQYHGHVKDAQQAVKVGWICECSKCP